MDGDFSSSSGFSQISCSETSAACPREASENLSGTISGPLISASAMVSPTVSPKVSIWNSSNIIAKMFEATAGGVKQIRLICSGSPKDMRDRLGTDSFCIPNRRRCVVPFLNILIFCSKSATTHAKACLKLVAR